MKSERILARAAAFLRVVWPHVSACTSLSAAIHTGSSLDWHESAEQLLSNTCWSVLLVFLLKPARIQSNKAEETKPLIFALRYKAIALVFHSGLFLTRDQQQLQP